MATVKRQRHGLSIELSECLLWVNRCVSTQRQRGPLSAVAPIGDKRERGQFVCEVPQELAKLPGRQSNPSPVGRVGVSGG
jgi:hypothetical protein